MLAAVDPSSLPVAGLQELVARTSMLVAQLEGIGARALGELQVRGGGSVPDGSTGGVCPTPAWLRSITGASGNAAGRRVRTSVALRELHLDDLARRHEVGLDAVAAAARQHQHEGDQDDRRKHRGGSDDRPSPLPRKH